VADRLFEGEEAVLHVMSFWTDALEVPHPPPDPDGKFGLPDEVCLTGRTRSCVWGAGWGARARVAVLWTGRLFEQETVVKRLRGREIGAPERPPSVTPSVRRRACGQALAEI
jgi:hypothetical protein